MISQARFRRWRAWLTAAVSLLPTAGALMLAAAPGAEFEVQEISKSLTVGYAVSLVDLNADDRLDIVVVDTERVVWYENPGWQEHVLLQGQTKPHNVCLAPHDIDGDGRIDFALGADWRPFDTQTGGTIQWLARGSAFDSPWEVRPIGEEPTVHRMRWANVDDDDAQELVVVPLMGRGATRPLWSEAPVRVLAYDVPADPRRDPWPMKVLNEELHVAHNFWPCNFDDDPATEILIVSYEGISLLDRASSGEWSRMQIGSGNQDTTPERGASEIKLGRRANGEKYIATVEPWHGFQIVVYSPSVQRGKLRRRQVLDDELKWGHAVWCANLDEDADEELIIGVRDDRDAEWRSGVRVYDPQPDGKWERQIVDPGGVAVEDLAAGDLDGDGKTDLVAVGRATKNVRIYWNGARRVGRER